MVRQPESPLQKRIREGLQKEFGGFWWKVHGSPYQPAGHPDLLGCVRGRYVALEVKRPGHVPSELQRETIIDIRWNGGIAGVVHSKREAIEFVRTALEQAEKGRPYNPPI